MCVGVTGSHGYIGAVMVPMLIEEEHEVVGVDTDLYGNCTYGEGLRGIPLIKKDIRDLSQTDVVGFEAIIHLA
jgi:nucleoside-diphosphate-sugar epimerase